MKRTESLQSIRIRMGLSVIAYDSLQQLAALKTGPEQQQAQRLAERIIELMAQRDIELSLCHAAPVSHLYIDHEAPAVDTEPAAVAPAPIVDYSTLIETAEQGVTDEVGTKV